MKTTEQPEKLLADARTASHLLDISTRTLHTETKNGNIPCVRIRNRVLYRIATLERIIAERES